MRSFILIGRHENQTGFLLTKRSSKLKRNPGMLTFPGGKKDMTDSSVYATATREAYEEVPGLKTLNLEILDHQFPLHTYEESWTYRNSPHLGLINNPIKLDIEYNDEVEGLKFVTFDEIIDPRNLTFDTWDGKIKEGHGVEEKATLVDKDTVQKYRERAAKIEKSDNFQMSQYIPRFKVRDMDIYGAQSCKIAFVMHCIFPDMNEGDSVFSWSVKGFNLLVKE